jgi:hypothetical protein
VVQSIRLVRSSSLVLVASLVLAGCGGAGASTAPALRFAVFLGQMVQAREQVEAAVGALVAAGSGSTAGMTATEVRTAAESLADVAVDQRAWLEENPPAPCYEGAHHAAATVADSLGAASTAALGWADAMDAPELGDATAGFQAFSAAAQDALGDVETLGVELEGATCLE